MNPYRRKIPVGKDGLSDVYDVTTAFNVTCPAIHHAIKKLLIPGVRTGGKSKVKDLEEAVQAVQRAVELAGGSTSQELNCPPKTLVLGGGVVPPPATDPATPPIP